MSRIDVGKKRRKTISPGVSRGLGIALDSPSKEIHDLDERAYQYAEDRKRKKRR